MQLEKSKAMLDVSVYIIDVGYCNFVSYFLQFLFGTAVRRRFLLHFLMRERALIL